MCQLLTGARGCEEQPSASCGLLLGNREALLNPNQPIPHPDETRFVLNIDNLVVYIMRMNDEALKFIQLVDRLARFFFVASSYGNALHGERGITTGQRSVLMEVARCKDRTINDMAQERGISKQAIQRTVDSLEKRALLQKVVHPSDRRARVLELTAAGQTMLQDIYRAELSELQALLPEAGGIEADTMISMLDRLERILLARTTTLRETSR